MNLGKQGDPLPIAASFHSLPRLVRFRASTAPRYSYPARVAALRFSVLANDVLRLVGPGLRYCCPASSAVGPVVPANNPADLALAYAKLLADFFLEDTRRREAPDLSDLRFT